MWTYQEEKVLWLRAVQTLLYLQTVAACEGGIEITALYVKKRPNDWILTLKANHGARAMVCFFNGHDLASCVAGLCSHLVYGKIKWIDDKYK